MSNLFSKYKATIALGICTIAAASTLAYFWFNKIQYNNIEPKTNQRIIEIQREKRRLEDKARDEFGNLKINYYSELTDELKKLFNRKDILDGKLDRTIKAIDSQQFKLVSRKISPLELKLIKLKKEQNKIHKASLKKRKERIFENRYVCFGAGGFASISLFLTGYAFYSERQREEERKKELKRLHKEMMAKMKAEEENNNNDNY